MFKQLFIIMDDGDSQMALLYIGSEHYNSI